MKLIPINKDTIPLILATVIVFGFFIGGMFEVLDYFIVKAVLILSFCSLFGLALFFAAKNNAKKNHPEDIPQDDSH
ncbi:hypothetical protein [Winogradskyella sp. UBA3174]|uniref:hypothetical protein n=1 Tax=Winogradskyella sp. UBA3174 TaxID=1947785 RepID=UPI0025FD4ECA|nr:hypothetical protein [Winogradskyella sp. UBA3174]|tara:strand:- start:6994 stop:7221 length:228 start_codon:yes stop_codon:yes gene_type:complete